MKHVKLRIIISKVHGAQTEKGKWLILVLEVLEYYFFFFPPVNMVSKIFIYSKLVIFTLLTRQKGMKGWEEKKKNQNQNIKE